MAVPDYPALRSSVDESIIKVRVTRTKTLERS